MDNVKYIDDQLGFIDSMKHYLSNVDEFEFVISSNDKEAKLVLTIINDKTNDNN